MAPNVTVRPGDGRPGGPLTRRGVGRAGPAGARIGRLTASVGRSGRELPEDAMKPSPEIQFFETPAAMRAWLEANHLEARELHVGYYRRHAVGEATPSITW